MPLTRIFWAGFVRGQRSDGVFSTLPRNHVYAAVLWLDSFSVSIYPPLNPSFLLFNEFINQLFPINLLILVY